MLECIFTKKKYFTG